MNLYLQLAVLLILAKISSDLSSRLKQPPILGLLLVGIILGPSVTNLIPSNEIIKTMGEIGVFILLFMAGLETDLNKMKKEGAISFTVASCGVSIPFLSGLGLTLLFGYNLPKALMLGTILTATSISVTVMTLWDIKKLDTLEGRTILSAAIIDDIMGILVLIFISAFIGNGQVTFFNSVSKLVLFFLISVLAGLLFIPACMKLSQQLKSNQSPMATSLGLMFIFACLAQYCGLAAITGAYMVGLFIGNIGNFHLKRELLTGFDTIGQSFFMSIFFINIGLEAQLKSIKGTIPFVILFILIAILSKIIGCTAGAKAFNLSMPESLRIGLGMVPRAEVALAISSIALAQKVIDQADFSMIVLLCLSTAIITPILLHLAFKESHLMVPGHKQVIEKSN